MSFLFCIRACAINKVSKKKLKKYRFIFAYME